MSIVGRPRPHRRKDSAFEGDGCQAASVHASGVDPDRLRQAKRIAKNVMAENDLLAPVVRLPPHRAVRLAVDGLDLQQVDARLLTQRNTRPQASMGNNDVAEVEQERESIEERQ